MPAISPAELVNAVLHAIQKSGGTGFYVSASSATHPENFWFSTLKIPFHFGSMYGRSPMAADHLYRTNTEFR